MELKSGDKIKFGIVYCNKTGRSELLNKTIMLTPQSFDEDNGLYSYESECPGICIDDEPDSIYHLFGNDLEDFYDCELIPATEEDLKMLDEARRVEEETIAKYYSDMADFFERENAKAIKEIL